MKNKVRLFACLVLFLLAAVALSACGGEPADSSDDDLSSALSSALTSYTYTGTAPTTTVPPTPTTEPTVTTAPSETTAAPPATTEPTVTTAPSETTAPPVTAVPPVIDETPLSYEELSAFLDLVDYDKVSIVQYYYFTYYVGTFRDVEECAQEIFDTITTMRGIRSVTDTEGATGVFIDVYVRAMGDYYGYYYSPTDYSDYFENINGEYTGIGVSVLVDKDGYAEILSVFPDSPAEDAGILPGDLLVAVEGEDFALIGYQNAIDRIRGESGTSVRMTVRRNGVDREVTMVRRAVTEVTVDSRMMGDIGYIRILSFNERTYEQFVAAHRELDAAGATSYVFDVRSNPGGTLNSVVAILEYILPDGPIVHLNYKDDRNDLTISSIYDIHSNYMDGVRRVYYAGHEIDKPIAVLANGGTASAGELFTSSLMDYGVATVIGQQTYGKGVGQTSLTLSSDRSAIVMTVFYYDPPYSENYDGVGIVPDIEIALSEEAAGKNLYKLTYEEDTQLQWAVVALTSLITQ